MPCERELKHLLNLVNAVTAPHRHGQSVSKRRLDDLANAQVEYEEAMSACDESPWRSMESAPKDGKYILIRHGDWVPDIAGWRDERSARPGVMAVPPGWFTVAGPRSRILEPTHWMPMPAAPEEKP